ncbi:MAG: PKD domain-containing protein, partial [Flavobacteriia bacterium]|nr:PKD domain-containing protein [Flavobacteriia bacterium]
MKLRLLISLVFAVTSLWNVQAQTVDIEQGGSPINSATACTGITLNLTANASGAGIPGYVWSYQGSPLAGQTTANLSFTFGSAGSGNLVVEYTDNGSTVASDTISLTVLANPSASWNPTDTIFCENETGISFSAGSGTFFGNGVSGNGNFDPSAAGAGVHTIGYYETNGVCADTVMRSIEVLASPNLSVAGTGAITIDGNPYFRVCTSSSSQGFQFFNSSSTGGLSNHYVDFGDGSTTTFASWPAPLTHTYTSPGLYFFRYAAQAPNGCWDTVTYRVFFGTNPSGGITTYGNTQGCEGSTFAFQLSNVSNNPDGTEYVVSFSDGSPAVTYSHPPPDTIFHTFNEGSCGFTTGGGTPFNNAYEASVVITNPCGTTSGDVRPIYVAEAPISGFEWLDPICLGTPTTFTDTSYAGTDPANGFCPGGSNRVWEITALTGGSFTIGSGFAGLRFGSDPQLWINGSSTIDVTFNQEGTYAINIYVWNTASCGVDSTTHIICVTNPPVTDIYIEDSVYLCSPDTTLIAYNGDIYGACDTTQLTWSITPNTGWSIVSSNDTSMQVRFNTAGEYYVSVTATNECGSDSETDTIFVFGEPTVFLPTDLTNCGPITIDFGAPPYVPVENDSLSPISARSWTITPGSGWTLQSGSLTGADPEILFSDPGVYQVVYSITNDCGTAYDTMLVEVYDVPVLDALNDTLICHLSDITVIASVTGGTPAYTWNWTLDGNPVGGNSDTLSLTNLTSGGIVQVIVTDQNGCADTVAFNLSVNPALSVSVTPDQTICYNDTLALSASGVGGSGPYTYVWTPGGQLSDSTIANPDFYADGSPVTLYVTVTDSEGCTATDSVQISIFPLTLVNAGPDTTFCFQNIVETLPTPNPTGGTWSGTGVVDGTVGTFNPFVAGLGTHQVVYRYEDANGCVFRDTIEVDVINPTPVSTMADFAVCLGDADVTLTATPSGGSWSVLSGSATVLTDSTFSPSIAGTYTILYTRGAGSCQTFDTLTIFVAENPILQNPGTFTICSGQTFSFTPSFQVPSSFEFRSFVLNGNVTGNTATGNGPIADVLINLSTSPDTVIYRFAGTRTDSAGCVGDSADVTVIVEPRPILQNTNLTDTICHGDVFTFVPNFNISGVTPLWTGSGAMQNQVRSSGSGNIVDTLFNPSGSIVSVTYQVYSFGLNSLSCGSDTTIITVWIQPEVVANAGGDLNLCSDEVGNLGEANQAGFSYDWTPGIHLSDSTISNPTFQYTNSGATNEVFTYVVLKTDLTTGCFDHDTVVVKVYPDPTFNAGSNIAFCNGDTVQLGANPGVGITYSWTSNPAGFTSSDAQPFVSPTVPTDYYVSYSVDSTGCTFQDTITVTPIANPVAIVAAVPDSGCSPLSLVLQDNSPGATARYWVVNGDTLADQNVTVNQTWINNSFTQDSIVEVILFIEAGTGCNASDTVQVYIHPKPFADFSMPSDVCANGTISTTNSSLVQGPETYLWTANSPGVVIINPTDAQPSITFPDNQSGSDSIYDITLTVTSVNGCVDDTTISITVFSRPVADFSLPARACGPATVNPTDLSTTNHPGLSYIWTVTPSAGVVTSGLNTATPSFDFPVSTADSVVYSILLGITDDNGCIDTLRQSYTVYPKPTANFNVALRDSCGPYTVQFNNISLPNQNPEDIDDMTFVWDFGNGQTSTAQQPSVTFTNTGVHDSTYYVTLIATNAYGCSDTIVDSITVYPNPLAELDVTGFVECAPYVIDSTVISAIQYPFANDTYTWTIYDTDFNSLGTFNGPNAVSYQLLTDGDSIYIGLSVENVHGCQEDTTLQLFYTIEDPTAAFAAIPDTGCTPLTVQIQDSSSSGVTYTWFVNGVQQGTTAANPSFTFQNQSLTQDSLITIQLVITAGTGCTDTTSRTVLVRPGPFAEFSIPSSVCANGSVATTNTSIAQGPETYFWTASSSSVVITNPTDAQPIFAFPDNQTGTDSIYDITLTVTSANGCTDDTTVSITVFSRPVADFSLPADGCGPTTINPTDLSTTNHPALSYVWTVSPTTGVTTAGMNTATPTIDFPVSLSDSVVYDILLAITDDNGCIDTLRQNYTVYPKPTAAYTVALRDSCGPFTVQFNNTSVPNQVGEDINDMTFAWDFGNGQTSTDQQPSAIITNSGVHDSTYFVTLIATNVYGCSDTIVDSITVYPNPLAQLDVTGFVACAPYVIDSSVVRAITYPFANDTYDWTIYDTDFNTITTFSGPSSVLYTLATDGDSVFVGLSVSNAHGCQVDTALQLFYTIENPIAAFAAVPDTGCTPLTVQIQDSSSVGVTYTWFVNGVQQATTAANPSFTFQNQSLTQDSLITIQLVITAGTGCTDTTSRTVLVRPGPLADFSIPSDVCASGSVLTTNNSVAQGPETYLWTASSTAVVIASPTDAQPIISFPDNQSGTDSIYDITLTVTSANGCTDDTTISITVYSRPVADFIVPPFACGPTTINPVDQSTTNNPLLSYTWTVTPNTGVVTSGLNTATPSISFPVSTSDSLVYEIFLTVVDDNGCSDTLRQNYTVYPKPTADFNVALRDSCGPFTVQFNNTSVPNQVGEDINDMTFVWDFGNGQSSTDQQPSAIFTNTGVHDSTYIVTLIATNAYGCSDTIVDSITVYPNPLAQLNVTGTVECAPYFIDSTVVSAVEYPFANDDYNWTVYDADLNVITTFNGPSSVNYTLPTDGDTVFIGLSVTNVHGCQEDTVLQRFYTIEDPIAAFAAIPDTGCSPPTVQIQDSSSVGVTYTWFINGMVQSTTIANPSFTFVNQSTTQDSTITIQLVITAGTGCTDTVAHDVTIYPQPFAEFSMPATTCANTSVATTNTSVFKAPESYLWTASSPLVVIANPTSAQPIIAFPDNQTGVDSIYDITLTVTSANGCTDDTTVSIIVFSRPVADFSLPANGCGPTTINPTDLSTTNHPALSYTWTVSPTTGVTTAGMNSAAPTIDFPVSQSDSVVYDIFLTITDDNGCIDTLRQDYTVYPKPTAAYTVALRDSCGPFTVQFNNTSVPNQAGEDINDMTFAWDFGNGQTSTDQQPSAVFTNTGVHDSTYVVTLIATNAYGCSDTIVDSITVYPNPLAQLNVTGTVECAPYLIDSTVVNAVQYPFANDDYNWTVYDSDFNVITTFNGPNSVNYTLLTDGDTIYIGLSATNVHGCQEDTVLQRFYTIENPVAAFAAVPDTGCSPLTVQIQDSSSVGVTYEWFINGVLQSTTQANPSFTFVNQSLTQDSTITIQLVITAGSGCTDTVAHNVTIYPQPFAEFSMPATTCANTAVSTTNTSAFKAPESYLWTASSPLVVITNPTDAQPIIAFPDNQTGVDSTYDITLTVTSANGCTDDTTVSITVFSRPVADFSLPANGCGPTTINPTDLSTTNHPALSYVWTVSPTTGVTTSGMNTASPTIDFPVSQNDSVVYDIFLTITDDNGCIDTLRQNYTVYPKPTATYTVALRDSCGPFTVQFNNTSVPNQAGEDINDMTFVWDFGNGQTSTDQQPSAVFTNTGVHDSTYIVTLIATNAYGCSDTIVDSITVYPNPLAQQNVTGTVECAPYLIDSTVVSAVQYPFANDDYTWTVYDTDFNTIATFNGPNAVNHTIQNDADSVYIGLSVTNVHGCQEDTLLQLFYTIEDPVAAFAAVPDTGCSPLTVQIQDSSSVGVTYEWFLNGVLQSTTSANPSFTFVNQSTTQDSTITIQLVITAGTGCTDTVAHDVTIYPQPFAEFSMPSTTCANTSVATTNTSAFKAPESYLWTASSPLVVITNPTDA